MRLILCFSQKATICCPTITVPSSLASSQMAATGGRPASLQRSTAASVWPERMSTPPSLATRGKTWPGRTKSARAHVAIGERAHGVGALLGRNAGGQPMTYIDRDGEGGAKRGVVDRHHRRKVQAPRVLAGQRRADDAAAVADDEGHLLGGAERGGDDQVALVLAVVVVGDGDDLAAGESLDGVGDGIDHVGSIGPRGRFKKIVRRDGALRLGHDPLGGFAREPAPMLAADQRHRAGRHADPAGEIRARHLIALKPVAELHHG